MLNTLQIDTEQIDTTNPIDTTTNTTISLTTNSNSNNKTNNRLKNSDIDNVTNHIHRLTSINPTEDNETIIYQETQRLRDNIVHMLNESLQKINNKHYMVEQLIKHVEKEMDNKVYIEEQDERFIYESIQIVLRDWDHETHLNNVLKLLPMNYKK